MLEQRSHSLAMRVRPVVIGTTARAVLALVFALVLACDASTGEAPAAKAASATSSSVVPAARADGMFLARRREIAAIPQRDAIRLVFLGDSITQRWEEQGRFVWNQYYARRGAANLGINADHTQHVLWRIRNGDLDGMRPGVVVLLIGTNNTHSNSDAEIADGVLTLVAELRLRLPEARILLLGLFPKSARASDPVRGRIVAINAAIARAAVDPMVDFVDIGDVFLAPDGSIPESMMPDALHLSARGYTRWAEAMEPTLVRLLDGDGDGAAEPSS